MKANVKAASFFKRKKTAKPEVPDGKLVARLLAGAWRPSPPPLVCTAQELAEMTALVLKSGASALAWYKVRNSELRASHAADQLHQIYRLYSLHALLHERGLKKVIPLLRNCGVEPLLVKGWAIARLYPEMGLRPYSDLDLCVMPGDYVKAQEALKSAGSLGCVVDLHSGFEKFYDRKTEDIFARSQLVRLDDLEVRVLKAEDDLRFLCMHLLRHGAARPLWLCDIAVSVETQAEVFNWDLCLSGSRRQADWIACSIGLAHRLLGAEVDKTPVADRAKNLPGWLIAAVVKEWANTYHMPAQFTYYLRRPLKLLGELIRELPDHWPNPIEATVTLKGPFNKLPRLPFQVGHIFSRAASLIAGLPKSFRPVKS